MHLRCLHCMAPTIAFLVVFTASLGTVRADTIYLKNGNWIDGTIRRESKTTIDIEIGKLGILSIAQRKVSRVERNTKEAAVTARSVTRVQRGKPSGSRSSRKSAKAKASEKTEADAKADDAARRDGKASKGSAAEVPAKKGQTATEVTEGRGGTAQDEAGKPSTETPQDDAVDGEDVDEDAADGDAVDEEAEAADVDEEDIDAKPAISPALEKEILRQVQELQRQRARNRVRAERRLKAIGKPALPYLLEEADHKSVNVRRAVFELIRRFGDDSAIDASIQALGDENDFIRDNAHRALRRITGENFGFRPMGAANSRRRSQADWKRWWKKEKKLLEKLEGGGE